MLFKERQRRDTDYSVALIVFVTITLTGLHVVSEPANVALGYTGQENEHEDKSVTTANGVGGKQQNELSETNSANILASIDTDADKTFLESIADLEHLSYLSLRNYNLTDEVLLQSSWLMGLGTALGPHKQHQKSNSALVHPYTGDLKAKLALMFESFISHLRNGHLKRMSLEDLDSTVNSLNLTDSSTVLKQRRLETLSGQLDASVQHEPHQSTDKINETYSSAGQSSGLSESELRCIHLVTLYKFDIVERQKAQQLQQQQQQRQQQQQQQQSALSGSRVEYENSSENANYSPTEATSNQTSAAMVPTVASKSDEQVNTTASTQRAPDNQASEVVSANNLDEIRLVRLCKLAVTCRSADELVNLISVSWKSKRSAELNDQEQHLATYSTQEFTQDESASSLERESSQSGERSAGQATINQLSEPADETIRIRHKSLRDSLSLSLAKLCPLMLFPLHETDGQCTMRRDDRPSMITVWGFATLFVTIVCFCSLIGLSITPLLGQSTAVSTGSLDQLSDPADPGAKSLSIAAPGYKPMMPVSAATSTNNKTHLHKASLTLFEGLAVGSLVGSALFSLIPQAFELQERESNHSFLLKAFIIFSGIYLFFLSERIMRIILDTRQTRKKKKRQLHRSSTTAAIDGLPSDFHNNNHHHHHHHHHHQQQQQQRLHQQSLLGSFSLTSAPPSSQQQFLMSSQQRQLTHAGGAGRQSSNRASSSQALGSSSGGRGGTRSREGKAKSAVSGKSGKKSPSERSRGGFNVGRKKSTNNMINKVSAHSDKVGSSSSFRPKSDARAAELVELTDMASKSSASKQQHLMLVREADNLSGLMKSATNPSGGDGAADLVSAASNRKWHRAINSGPTTAARSGRIKARSKTTRSQQLSRRQRRQKRNHGDDRDRKPPLQQQQQQQQRHLAKKAKAAARHRARVADSDIDDYYYHLSLFGPTSSSSSTDSSTSSFTSYTLNRKKVTQNGLIALQESDDSQADYSSSSSSSTTSKSITCSSCASNDDNLRCSDSDDDNTAQARAVSKQMSFLSRRLAEKHQQQQQHSSEQAAADLLTVQSVVSPSPSPLRTTFKFDDDNDDNDDGGDDDKQARRAHSRLSSSTNRDRPKIRPKQDISTVAWMIVLGDGLHNFIDGISIGAAFSESILSGVSISVAVICEEFPHELGDFAVLVSAGMTVRQALGYNFLSACTCYFGTAVGIILGDVTDGASYISALAAGVFLYIALVDMMGELSATLESSSRDSITRTLKLLLLQNVGIFIGISIIFVLSFIDF